MNELARQSLLTVVGPTPHHFRVHSRPLRERRAGDIKVVVDFTL